MRFLCSAAQLRDIAYGTKTYSVKVDATAEDEADKSAETVHLESGENLLELQIVGVTLSDSALQMLGEAEPATFCTYAFYVFELHATPVMTGRSPKYDFTSKYVVSVDDRFLDYLHRGAVRVELHEALGLDWRTLAAGELRLQQLLEQDGKVHSSVALVGESLVCGRRERKTDVSTDSQRAADVSAAHILVHISVVTHTNIHRTTHQTEEQH